MDTKIEPPQKASPVGHETTDVNVKGLFIFAGSLLVALVVVLAGVVVLFEGNGFLDRYLDKRRAEGEPGSNSLVRVSPNYAGPLLQVVPEQDLRQMRDANAAALGSYGWVDRPKGIVRLPIDRAMDLVAQRGLPPVSPGVTVEQMQQPRADPQVYGQSLRP